MKNLLFLLFITFFMEMAIGQHSSMIINSIYLNDSEDLRDKPVEKLIIKNWEVYRNGEVHFTQTEKDLNEKNQCIIAVERNYDPTDSTNALGLSEVFDTFFYNKQTGLIEKKIFKLKFHKGDKHMAYQSHTYKYYDNNCIAEIISPNYRQVFSNCINGFPQEVKHGLHPKQGRERTEIAEYFFDQNIVVVKNMWPLGDEKKFTTMDTAMISPKQDFKFPNDKRLYNLHGDLVFEKQPKGFIHYEYQYDDNFNWIRRERLDIDLSEWKIKLKEVTVRAIKYR